LIDKKIKKEKSNWNQYTILFFCIKYTRALLSSVVELIFIVFIWITLVISFVYYNQTYYTRHPFDHAVSTRMTWLTLILPYSNETLCKLSYKRFSLSLFRSPYFFLFASIVFWTEEKKTEKIEEIKGVTRSDKANNGKWGYPSNVRVSRIKWILISNNFFFFFLNMHLFSLFIMTFKSLILGKWRKKHSLLFFFFFLNRRH
jgi:hypothetical protein